MKPPITRNSAKERLSIVELAEMEPELVQLMNRTRQIRLNNFPTPRSDYNQDRVYLDELKPWVNRLVGRRARSQNPLLRSPEAYETVIRWVQATIPSDRSELGIADDPPEEHDEGSEE